MATAAPSPVPFSCASSTINLGPREVRHFQDIALLRYDAHAVDTVAS